MVIPKFTSYRWLQGYELRPQDVGRWLSFDFGNVAPSDVGRKIWGKSWGIVMESMEQAKQRKEREGGKEHAQAH